MNTEGYVTRMFGTEFGVNTGVDASIFLAADLSFCTKVLSPDVDGSELTVSKSCKT